MPQKPARKTGPIALLKKRLTIQIAALVLSNAYVLNFMRFIPCGYLQCSNCAASTFTCPLILFQRGAVMASMGVFGGMFGGFWAALTDSSIMGIQAKLLASMAGGAAMLVLFGAALGTWGCGWLCPFGFVQDLIGRLKKKKFYLPGWVGHLRIPVLIALVIAVPYYTRSMFFCDVCPPGAINRLWQQAAGIPLFFKTPEGTLAIVSLGILGVFMLASVFISRPFCSTACPIGGVLGVMNRVSGLTLRVDGESCRECGLCSRACPQGIDPVKEPSHILCTRCLKCTGTCTSITTDIRL